MSESESSESTVSGAVDGVERRRVPPWKNPWIVGWVAGMVVITGIRPFLRRIPDPPPVLAQAGSVELVADGSAWTPADVATGSSLIVVTGELPSESSAALTLLRKLSVVFAGESFDEVTFVVVSPASDDAGKWAEAVSSQIGASAGRWIFATGPGVTELDRLVDPLTGGAGVRSGVILLDASGQVRGFYGAQQTDSLSEVYHRTRHVVSPPREDV